MKQTIVRIILGMYPPWWRHRYGAETADLTEQLLDEPGTHRWRVMVSLLSGSLMAWMQLRRINAYLSPLDNPNEWGVIPRGSHRDLFGNRGLWPRSEAELDPGELLLGVLDGNSGSRLVVFMPMWGVMCAAIPLIMSVHFRPVLWSNVVFGAAFLAIGLILRPLTNSYYVAVAVTSHGVVLFRRGITGRTGKMIERMPAVEPELVKVAPKFGPVMRKVHLGERTLWLNSSSDALLYWMSNTLRSAGAR
jgi:hypothetical protein